MNKLRHKYVVLFARLVLGLVFIIASIDKILDPQAFSDAIDNYHITPLALNNFFALIIPWLELIIGICLIFGFLLDGAVFITICLLVWFIFIISQALFRGIDINCGCFDLSQKNLEDVNLKLEMYKRLLEDFVFLILAFIIKNRKRN